MKVSAREARRFLAFWALGFAENLEKPKESEGFWRAKRADFSGENPRLERNPCKTIGK